MDLLFYAVVFLAVFAIKVWIFCKIADIVVDIFTGIIGVLLMPKQVNVNLKIE